MAFSPFLQAAAAFSSFSKSSMRVAPSASTINSHSPLACSMPCCTAPPLPWFLPSFMTRTVSDPSCWL
jgi:hypothetical protein